MSVVGHFNDLVNEQEFEKDHQSMLDIVPMEHSINNDELIHRQTNGNEEKCIEDAGNNTHTASIADGENAYLQSPKSSECSGKSFVLKVPRANSKLILQNMEEVLNSVKKKHRQKHRRKKEQKKLAMLAEAGAEAEIDIDAEARGQHKKAEERLVINKMSRVDSPSLSTSSSSSSKALTKSVKKPLKEQQALQDQSEQSKPVGKVKTQNNKRRSYKTSISPTKSTISESLPTESNITSNGILHPLIRTPMKTQKKCNDDIQLLVEENMGIVEKTSKPATNAFEVMMNARNKSIGSNTPGKESNMTVEDSPGSSNTVNAKRKLMLQNWADRKGGLKRKIDEEMRAAFVEERLEYRAKRLKKMLTSGNQPDTDIPTKNISAVEIAQKKVCHSTLSKSDKPKSKQLRRSRRLSSSDSVESQMEKRQPLDQDTVEFLSKLSSPTKKRDSLLGYFTKIPSPNEGTGNSSAASTPVSLSNKNSRNHRKSSKKTDSETPRARGRPKSKKTILIDVEDTKSTKNIEYEIQESQASLSPISTTQIASRPRRTCVDKAKYDYDLDVENSPKKGQKIINVDERRRNKCKRDEDPITVDDANDINIIDLDSSSSFNIETKTPKKLAPLFTRSMPLPKTSVDSEALKARQEFLRSGVPDKLKLEQERQKTYERTYEECIELFPKINHLQQWSQHEKRFLAKIPSKSKFRIHHLNDLDESFSCETNHEMTNYRANGSGRKGKAKGRSGTLLGITNCSLRDFRPDRKSIRNGASSNPILLMNLPIVSNKREIIKLWKADFDRFPTYKCYNQLRTKYRFFSVLDSAQNTEQVTESFVVTRSTRRSLEVSSTSNGSQDEDIKPPETAPNGELLFTEKYKPMLFDQVLVNLTPVSQLRDFLASWANGNGGGSTKNSQNIDDSMDFMSDSNSSQQAVCNSVVLLGPASSGKTNAVFTLANEMNFNVLEINAGMKRTGKKITQELLEATQSHQIRNESTGGSSVKSKAQKHLLKMSLNSLKGRKATAGSNSNSNSNSNLNEIELPIVADLNVRKCLILIEDADIIFEQTDAGFTEAVYTLAASSKRPVIVIATNPNCQHLQRLMAQNTIKFTAPNALSISKYLSVLSLMENCPVSLDDLISLYLYNQHDLRKTLHELQFFIQSGGDLNKQLNSINPSNPMEQNIQKQQKTPQKQSELNEMQNTGQYFASPGKKSLSEDAQSSAGAVHDEQLRRETHQHQHELNQQQQQQQKSTEEELYVHRTLFEFYTVDQNAKWRIPFPVNFDLFYVNLSYIFGVAKKLKPQEDTNLINASLTSKRKTRSPKKVWLSTATANSDGIPEKSKNLKICESLNALNNFYKNVSIATSMVALDECASYSAKASNRVRDRLMPYLSESIAHDILESAINVNLEAELCPYNLFDSQKKSANLCDMMGPTIAMIPKRSRFMDFEPALRAICRSEQQRSAQERRSTRFYHYLRNSCIDNCNFSHFENVCRVFQDQQDVIGDKSISET